MNWDVEYTDEFEAWWESIGLEEQERVTAAVELLEERGFGEWERWYVEAIPVAERLFAEYLEDLRREGEERGSG